MNSVLTRAYLFNALNALKYVLNGHGRAIFVISRKRCANIKIFFAIAYPGRVLGESRESWD